MKIEPNLGTKLIAATTLLEQFSKAEHLPRSHWNQEARRLGAGASLISTIQWLSGKAAWSALRAQETHPDYVKMVVAIACASAIVEELGLCAGQNLQRFNEHEDYDAIRKLISTLQS